MSSGIYNIINILDGSRYVGQSANLDARKHSHFLMLKGNRHDNKHLQYAVNKYGLENFEFRILEENVVEECLTAQEQYWFDIVKRQGIQVYNHGLMTDSPVRGTKHSSETIAYLSSIRRGKKLTEEWKENIRKSCLGINTKPVCPKGHIRTPENSYRKSTCKLCCLISSRKQKQLLKGKKYGN